MMWRLIRPHTEHTRLPRRVRARSGTALPYVSPTFTTRKDTSPCEAALAAFAKARTFSSEMSE